MKNDLERERKKGLSIWYLKDVLFHRKRIGSRHHTPGFGLAAQLFSVMCKHILKAMGPEKGEELIKNAVEEFGLERGRRIAGVVKGLGKPLSFKNWLIYTDVDGGNFPAKVSIEDGSLVACVGNCSFDKAAKDWGLEECARHYCTHVDFAILKGYNPDIRLDLDQRWRTGENYCRFKYGIREK
ncbi:MAG: hypothetical protein CVV44_10560 [Spirochaetae bacterium HGW-Spirochaetae-1]|jgi:hypothetical protein|nr:MAG: hypothetical protein CVV44_10560 [Spirochaetae bacterium HGW-Spirochaetae-1]